MKTDETKLILSALNNGECKKRNGLSKKRFVEPDLCDPNEPDAITDYAKRMRKKPKPKMYLSQWTSVDFIRHLNDNLKAHGLELETSSVRDQDWMNKLHDSFINKLETEMSNRVLREYLDWWVGTYIHVYAHKVIYVKTLMNVDYIDRFVSQWKEQYGLAKPIIEREEVDISDRELFNLSGLSVLTMTKGIVAAWKVIQCCDGDGLKKISDTLGKLSREKLIQTLDKTMSERYNKADTVDFISLAKEALMSHSIATYDDVDYKTYFQERK